MSQEYFEAGAPRSAIARQLMSTHDRDKVLALLKSLGAPCETKGKSPDHAWRKCRHCLAQQETDHEDIRALIRQFVLEADAALRACAEARPSTEQTEEDASPRSENQADRDRLQSSAPTDGVTSAPAPNWRNSVQQAWTWDLAIRMQSLVMLAMRGPDGCAKVNGAKTLLRELRSVVLVPAFPGKPDSFMGTQTGRADWTVVDAFAEQHDEYPHHWLMHFIHACEVVGQFHPEDDIRTFWWNVYTRLCHAMHMQPESIDRLIDRLGPLPAPPRAEARPSTDQGWQPIESVSDPIDRDHLLGSWLDGDQREVGEILYVTGRWLCVMSDTFVDPTHWMPLPEAPTETR